MSTPNNDRPSGGENNQNASSKPCPNCIKRMKSWKGKQFWPDAPSLTLIDIGKPKDCWLCPWFEQKDEEMRAKREKEERERRAALNSKSTPLF